MRHGIAGKKLGRNSSWRKATVRDIAKAALIHQRICTTRTKAKEARKLVDRLITLGKKGTLAHRRRAFAILCDHRMVSTLFDKTAPRFKQRSGGYTRLIPLSVRRGDAAQLTYLELTEKDAAIVTRPRSRATAKTKAEDVPATTAGPAPAAAPVKKEAPAPAKEKKPRADKDKTPTAGPDDVKKPPRKGKGFSGLKKIFQRKEPGQ